jgi:O-antigen/teichoic acid export membrane protein
MESFSDVFMTQSIIFFATDILGFIPTGIKRHNYSTYPYVLATCANGATALIDIWRGIKEGSVKHKILYQLLFDRN